MADLKTWFLAMRPWSFNMSVISVTLGVAWAAREVQVSWGLYLASVAAMVALHAGGNLLNDYFDVRSGVDAVGVPTSQYRPHPLLEGRMRPGQVLTHALAFYGVAAILGVWLALEAGPFVLVLGAAGILGGVLYTAPPLSYKHHGLGELGVFMLWGPLAVLGGYYVQTGTLASPPVLISIPIGTWVALVLLANNMRDREFDRTAKLGSLAVRMGAGGGHTLFSVLVAGAYGAVLVMAFLGPLSPWSLLAFLTLPGAFLLVRSLRSHIPEDADARVAKLSTVFGALLIAGVVLEAML